jgi:hypothetical protein
VNRQSNVSPQPNAGVTTDNNFAAENWDDEDANDDGADDAPQNHKAQAKETSRQTSPLVQAQSGVKADSNWLNEDFDD